MKIHIEVKSNQTHEMKSRSTDGKNEYNYQHIQLSERNEFCYQKNIKIEGITVEILKIM